MCLWHDPSPKSIQRPWGSRSGPNGSTGSGWLPVTATFLVVSDTYLGHHFFLWFFGFSIFCPTAICGTCIKYSHIFLMIPVGIKRQQTKQENANCVSTGWRSQSIFGNDFRTQMMEVIEVIQKITMTSKTSKPMKNCTIYTSKLKNF